MRMIPSLPLLARTLVVPALLWGAAAQAQGLVRPPPTQTAPALAAPALPGLAARQAPAPIPRNSTESLAPNAALFDAISRGDLAAAREAVARGANLDARNALGLTPLDTAVDQGRNDIAFYLLSARDGNRGFVPPANSSTPSGTAPFGTARVGSGAPPPASPAGSARRGATNAARPVQAAAPRGPRLFAENGGAPLPAIGFLGFDAGRPAGASEPGASEPAPALPGSTRRPRR